MPPSFNFTQIYTAVSVALVSAALYYTYNGTKADLARADVGSCRFGRIFSFLSQNRLCSLALINMTLCAGFIVGKLLRGNVLGRLRSSRRQSMLNSVVQVTKLTSIRQFQDLMGKARECRRIIVKAILERRPFNATDVQSLGNIERTLEDKLEGADDGVTMTLNGIELDIHDEMQMFKKDSHFLSYFKDDGDVGRFVEFLSESHPRSKEAFMDETDAFLRILNSDELSSGIDVFITDWDGTMKTYASNYQTSIQPVYSGVILSLFVKHYTKLAAVLTAGPLRNFGILDSTSVPWEDGYLTFGGSWGREWMINRKRVAEENILTSEGNKALAMLGEAIERLLEKEEFNRFVVVGSGYQRKVDRITIGIQNVTGRVDGSLSGRYIEAVLQEVHRIDPDERIFEVVRLDLELEVALKAKEAEQSWTKADGIQFLMETVGMDPADCSILICGDTISDVPMVEAVCRVNPTRTYAVFVNPNEQVKRKVSSLLPDKHCFVGCPEVLHAAMAKKVFSSLFTKNNSPP